MDTRIIKRVIRLGSYEYYLKHFGIVNLLLPTNMTEREIEILSCFMDCYKRVVRSEDDNVFSSEVRKCVMEEMGLSSQSISNSLTSLCKKGVLIKDNGKYMLKGFLYPCEDIQQYQIGIVNEDKDGVFS